MQELEKQRLAYEKHSLVLDEADAAGENLPLKVEILVNAIRSWSGSGALDPNSAIGAKLNLSNLDHWLLLAKKDPSFSSDVLRGWVDTLEAHIRHSLTRFECAKLFGNLFNEWLSSGDSVTAAKVAGAGSNPVDAGDEFVNVGRQEMYEQKTRLNSLIFEPKRIDTDAVVAYLSELFHDTDANESLQSIRKGVDQFGNDLLRTAINSEDIRFTIKALLASDLMDETKRTTLREFTENPTVLAEVASVLNMRLGSLGSWCWPATGVDIEMRRHLNGKYRGFTDPEILDALFLQYLGTLWQIVFKNLFCSVFQGKAWKPAFSPLSKFESDRRKYYLGENDHFSGSIESHRHELRAKSFMVNQLSSSQQQIPRYDDSINDCSDRSQVESATAIKQKLLHIMTTDCYINTALNDQHTIVCTDLEWFGPSLSHSSILTLLEFFGLSPQWLKFFESFLRAPLRFKDEPGVELRTRECGTPIGYALSALCGEVVLFAMGFAVNQRANGMFLYRIHDDLWLWDAKPEKCVAAWREVDRYASLVGLNFNRSKTGSACVGAEIHPELPLGEIRWGFLKFESEQARFVIDQRDVDSHITELRRQLAATKSVFGWVNVYNKYLAFFVRNFGGRPANCLGRAHVDDMIDTLSRIQRELFPDTEGDAVGYLRSILEERFGVRSLPQGYFYFPIGSGGLEIRNPMIELLALRESVLRDPRNAFVRESEMDIVRYNHLKVQWESSPSQSTVYVLPPARTIEFMPYHEYISQRETRFRHWCDLYKSFLIVVNPVGAKLTPAVEAAIKGTWTSSLGWNGMDYYDKWVVSLYGEEVMKNFGSLEVVDPALIPVGMVQLFRSSRVRLDQ